MMISSLLLWFLLFFSPTHADNPVQYVNLDPVTKKIIEADWEEKEVSEGILWKYHQFQDLFNAVQSVTILELDLKDEDVKVVLPHVESGFMKTSEAARTVEAAAAINGSFFDTKTGGSVVFLKKEGAIINSTRKGFNLYRENAGFAIGKGGEVAIIAKPDQGWQSLEGFSTILASGPLLMENSKLSEQVKKPFNENRHPRTAIGITSDRRLIAVVVDGRNSQAHGMNIAELGQLMKALGCTAAMNLDGGGSTTAWVRNHGVVNYPSDNKTFDHHGERGVATVIGFVTKEE